MAKKKKDDTMARVRALFEESGLALVELGRRMGYPEETARQSAWQFMKTTDPRMSMLRKFAEAMEVGLDQITTRRPRMSRKLEAELHDCGCSMDAKMFRDLIIERHATMHPAWTEDDLTCHPDDAKRFCTVIRGEAGNNVSDYLILRTLLNTRKGG